jgi:hypothetical protein
MCSVVRRIEGDTHLMTVSATTLSLLSSCDYRLSLSTQRTRNASVESQKYFDNDDGE